MFFGGEMQVKSSFASLTRSVLIAAAAISLVMYACGGSGQVGTATFELAHNTERSIIMFETSQVLPFYNFVLELSDEQRDREAIQTSWRVNYGLSSDKSDPPEVPIRDRVFLHLSPRGKSSIQVNVYQMVNATLQFEIQMKEGDSWVDMTPLKEYEDQYRAIVRDIRNRMLRHLNEF